jgi:hypothetical protein
MFGPQPRDHKEEQLIERALGTVDYVCWDLADELGSLPAGHWRRRAHIISKLEHRLARPGLWKRPRALEVEVGAGFLSGGGYRKGLWAPAAIAEMLNAGLEWEGLLAGMKKAAA